MELTVGEPCVPPWPAWILLSLIFLTLLFTTHWLASATIALVIWGIAGWSLYPAQQHRLLTIAPEHSSVILALNGSALYLGVAVGSALGGLVLTHASVSALGIAGGLVALLALGIQLLSTRRAFTPVSPSEQPEQEAPMRTKEQAKLEPLH